MTVMCTLTRLSLPDNEKPSFAVGIIMTGSLRPRAGWFYREMLIILQSELKYQIKLVSIVKQIYVIPGNR